MFVCIVHCAAGSFVTESAMQMAHSGVMKHHEKACDCCKKHGSYVVKENLKPATDLQFTPTAFLIPQFKTADFLLTTSVSTSIVWHDSNAPPGKSGKTIIIQNRSFLI